jgi:hypothetical protein
VTGYERKVNPIFEHRLGSFQNAFLLGKGYGMHVVAKILHFPFIAHKLLLFKIKNFSYIKKLLEFNFAKAARLFGEFMGIFKCEKHPVEFASALPFRFAELGKPYINKMYYIVANLGVNKCDIKKMVPLKQGFGGSAWYEYRKFSTEGKGE